jgi:branched-chain amino acid transport system substrate-binding protein
MKNKWIFLIPCLIVSIILFGKEWLIPKDSEKKIIHIAVVGPMSGQGQLIGQSLKQGIHLAIDTFNKSGGVNGYPVSPIYYDDQNNPEKAESIAKDISKTSAIGVIGHWYSDCAISAGEVYQKTQIPVITPGATNVLVTRFNPWSFRTVFNDSIQGQFIANYAKKVLHFDSAAIIYENDTYGAYLATVFEAKAEILDIDILYNDFFETKTESDSDQLMPRFDSIIEELKQLKPSCMIFLATHASEGVQLVRRIKDAELPNIIMGPDAFGSQVFQSGFDNFPKEKATPGYYTNGIYTTAHLIFDTAEKRAQEFRDNFMAVYHKEPDWIAASAFDTANVMLQAIESANIVANTMDIQADRFLVRQRLSKMNHPDRAVVGLTCPIYFNIYGDAVDRPVAIGIYNGRHLVSAMTQLQSVQSNVDPHMLSSAIEDKRVIKLDNRYMYKTQVVYTGIELIEIQDFNDKKAYCNLDFYLWFRCRNDIDIQMDNIVFTNRILPDDKEASSWTNTVELVKSHSYQDRTQYLLFRVTGRFQTSRVQNASDLDRHFLNVCFRHKHLTRNNLIYVIDVMGMGLAQQLSNDTSQIMLTGELSRWRIDEQKVFQDIWENTQPKKFMPHDRKDDSNDYSRFHFGVVLQKNKFSLRGLIPKTYVSPLLLITLLVNILFAIINRHYSFRTLKGSMWVVETLSAFVFMLSVEILMINRLSGYLNTYHLSLIKMGFDIMWWILPAFFINLAVKRFIWAPFKEKNKHSAPRIIRNFGTFMIYLIAFIGIVAFVFEQEITKILATGGLFAMIIGFAVQMNISNLISGIAINLEDPFRIGDWVKIGDAEGKVVDITWRSTRIRTAENCIFSIPNSMASESFIANFNYPDDINWLTVTPHIDPLADPQKVKKILIDAVLSTTNILQTPEPYVIYKGLTEWASDYQVFFCIKDFANKHQELEDVWKRIWKHLEYAGIQIVIQEQEFPVQAREPIFFWDEMTLFQLMEPDDKEKLLNQMTIHIISPQKTIINEGDFGHSLFFIQEGVVTVQLRLGDDSLVEINRLGVGSFFGEMAFFSDHHRSASIVTLQKCEIYEVNENDFMPLITKYPKIAELLTKTQMKRQEQQSQEKESYQYAEIADEDLSTRLWSKILDLIKNWHYSYLLKTYQAIFKK